MTTETATPPTATGEPAGPAPAPRGRWSLRASLAAAGVAAVIAGPGAAAVYAATAGDTPPFGGMHPPGPGGPGGRDHASPAVLGADALHGEFVLPDGRDGYHTVLTQTGTITALDPASVTVHSTDGYTQTYRLAPLPSAGTPPFTVGDSVTVQATRQGPALLVDSIGRALIGPRSAGS